MSLIACSVCFGQSDSPMAWAMNMGIFVMLLIVGGVLVGFASFFVHLMRRARLAGQVIQSQAHFQRVASNRAQRLVHVGQQRRRAHARAVAHADNAVGQFQ